MNHYKATVTTEKLHSRMLMVDPEYQRSLNSKQVDKIIAEYNPLLVNPVKVSRHSDGTCYVFDGQHTLNALKRRNGGEATVECKVYEFLEVSDEGRKKIEASLFSKQNGVSRSVNTADRFKALYASGNQDIIDLREATKEAGIVMDFVLKSGRSRLICHSEAYRAYQKLGKDTYVYMLKLIKKIWEGDKNSLRKEIIGGMTLFFLKYGDQIREDVVVRQLSKQSPMVIIRNGGVSTESGKAKYCSQIEKLCGKNFLKGIPVKQPRGRSAKLMLA